MNKIRFTLKASAFLVFVLACSSAANAQATRTWVSGVGDDVNPCSRTAPCKTFAGAISKTATGGEIDCLDPGGFGAVTITKSITIDGTYGAGFGSILSSGTNGVIVNDTTNVAVVSLRNLSINGAGTGLDGVRFLAGKELNVESCAIFGFKSSGSSDGIDVSLTAAVAGNQRVFIKDTIIRDNAGNGIRAANTGAGGAVNLTVENTRSFQNNNGMSASTASRWIVKDSSFNVNASAGVEAAAGQLGIDLDNCLMHSNVNGILLSAGTVRIANCRITNNNNGINFTGGTLATYGDNKIDGNGADTLGGSIPGAILKR